MVLLFGAPGDGDDGVTELAGELDSQVPQTADPAPRSKPEQNKNSPARF